MRLAEVTPSLSKRNTSFKRTILLGSLVGIFAVPGVRAQQPDAPIASPTIPTQQAYYATLPTQPIGPNDLIGVSVYDSPELSGPVRVDGKGMIRLPMLKNTISANDLLPSQLETVIANALKAGNVLVDPVVTVTVVEYQSRPVSVMGAVKNPLIFQISHPTTLLEALARAGGITKGAGPNILVTHSIAGQDGKSVQATQTIATRSLIDAADPSLNIQLQGGDTVLVPQARDIYVLGNVKKPGAFPVQDNGQTTVLQALALAEGLTPDSHKLAYIYRKDGSGAKQEIPVELGKIVKRKSPDVPLQPDDILYVPDNAGRREARQIMEYSVPAVAAAAIYGAFIY